MAGLMPSMLIAAAYTEVQTSLGIDPHILLSLATVFASIASGWGVAQWRLKTLESRVNHSVTHSELKVQQQDIDEIKASCGKAARGEDLERLRADLERTTTLMNKMSVQIGFLNGQLMARGMIGVGGVNVNQPEQ